MMGAAMQTNLLTPRKSAPLLAVTAPEDIEFLVKESEVLTGQPGRIFVIAGAERLSYRVRWQLMGFKVARGSRRHDCRGPGPAGPTAVCR